MIRVCAESLASWRARRTTLTSLNGEEPAKAERQPAVRGMLAFPCLFIRQPKPPDSALTPVMRQFAAAKRLHPDALLFFRMGDFYELFYEDATIASRELQIQLTARDRERTVPMCGVPYHAAEGYLARLLRKGYRIAICDQMEDPKLTKKIVRREVTRVLTPGTAIDSGLSVEQNNFLAAIHFAQRHRSHRAARSFHRRLPRNRVSRAGRHLSGR